MAQTTIKPCTCPSPYQDRRYGVGRRLHNAKKRGARDGSEWRCTVCGRER